MSAFLGSICNIPFVGLVRVEGRQLPLRAACRAAWVLPGRTWASLPSQPVLCRCCCHNTFQPCCWSSLTIRQLADSKTSTPEIKQIEYVLRAELAPGVRYNTSPGIEFTGAVSSVGAEESRGHPEVKHTAPCQGRGALWVPPREQDGTGGLGASLERCLEEKVGRKGHVCLSGRYRSANLAESTFKSSPAFTDCSKKLLNFLCDLTVFLSG